MTEGLLSIYYVVAGGALVVAGARSGAWWTMTVGALLFAAGLAVRFGRGESTSWLRGDLDERRQKAADHSFRAAFLALAWWVAGVTIVATSREVPVGVWSGGIVLALVVAYCDYALVLRRS